MDAGQILEALRQVKRATTTLAVGAVSQIRAPAIYIQQSPVITNTAIMNSAIAKLHL